MRNFAIFILCSFLLVGGFTSCKTDSSSDKKASVSNSLDMKKYYFPTTFDGKTRYYLYEDEIRNGKEAMTILSSYRVERTGGNKLVFVKYHHFRGMFMANDSSIVRIKKDGLYSVESYFFKDEWIPYDEIANKKVLSWNWSPEEECSLERNIPKELADKHDVNWIRNRDVFRSAGTGKLDKPFDNKEVYAILKGKSESSWNGGSETFEVEYGYLEGLGLYSVVMKSEGSEQKSLLLDELTKAEYEDLFR